MPMFYTPKPRQFHYTPRLYDPEKEKIERLKQKYRSYETGSDEDTDATNNLDALADADVEYFKRKVQAIDREERIKNGKFTLKDVVRKREMPKFNYTPRFDENGKIRDTATQDKKAAKHIRHRFDTDEVDTPQPVPAGKIILYTLIVFLLSVFVFSDVLPMLLGANAR